MNENTNASQTNANTDSNTLAAEEKVVIAAFRTGDPVALLNAFNARRDEMDNAAGQAEIPFEAAPVHNESPRVSEDELMQAHNKDAPDTTMALAGYIVGALMLRRYFAMSLLKEDNSLFWLVEDVANAIKHALPTLDMIELNHMAEAARKSRKS